MTVARGPATAVKARRRPAWQHRPRHTHAYCMTCHGVSCDMLWMVFSRPVARSLQLMAWSRLPFATCKAKSRRSLLAVDFCILDSDCDVLGQMNEHSPQIPSHQHAPKGDSRLLEVAVRCHTTREQIQTLMTKLVDCNEMDKACHSAQPAGQGFQKVSTVPWKSRSEGPCAYPHCWHPRA